MRSIDSLSTGSKVLLGMKNRIEPTYLRYIYDGLINNTIHLDNTSSLPNGFIGLYDEVFDNSLSVLDKQKNIRIFSIWALLKKEVTVFFVAKILNEEENYIVEFISKYSKWFNSPEPGKFVLYHELLIAYILQRISNKQIIEFHQLICKQKDDESDYLSLYKIDHQIFLGYFDSEYYELTKEVVSQIDYEQTDDKDSYLAKKRWFKSASILSGYFEDFNFIKQLYVKYNEFLYPQLNLDEDWKSFQSNGVYFLLDKAQSFFSNQKEAYIYLIYYLHLLLHQKDLIKKDSENLVLLINQLNQMSKLFIDDGDFILNKNYFNYLNSNLRKKELQLLMLDAGLDGFPTLMTEDGFGGMFDYGFYINNKIIYFGDGNWNKGKIENILIKSFECIEGIPDSPEIAKSLLSILHKGDIKSIESFLQKVKSKLIYSETTNWDDLLTFDHFVFEVFKFVSINNIRYNFISWRNLFVCSPKLWQQNISFWKMLVDIDLEGDVDMFYRNYKYGSNEISDGDKYIIDELGFISLVLSLNDRNFDIPFLIKKSFKVLLNKSYYNYAVDILSSSFLLGSVKAKNLAFIKKYFYKNEIISITVYLQQLCGLLSDKFDFLDLIDFVYYDYHLQSDVSGNYEWSLDIINSIKNKKSTRVFLNYVIKGFDIFIDIMGKYSLDEFKNPEDCPPENKWKIEWWVMCNFYASIVEVLKNDKQNLERFINSIENIFFIKGFDSKINLNEGLDRYLSFRKTRDLTPNLYFEFQLHQNPKHQLLLFKDNMNNKEIVSKIAGSINSGNLNIN
jgi:hypothetical protein